MENHASHAARAATGALLATVVLLASCASNNNAPEAIDHLKSDAHVARLEAIVQLGESKDPLAGEALVVVLGEPNANVEERESTWFEVARALEQLAHKGLVGEEALPALDKLAAQKPSLPSTENSDEPRFPFARVAADAAREIRLNGSKRSTNHDDGQSGKTQAEFLSELAWIQRIDEDEQVHLTALESLKKLGVEGIEPSTKLVGKVRPQSRGDMVAYFVELHAETGEQGCLNALTILACSRHEAAWRPSLVALKSIGGPRASKRLIEKLEADEVPDDERTQLTLEALGGIGSERAVPFLASLFGHASDNVARSASYALIDIGDAAVPALLEEIDDIDRRSRMMAALALSRLGDRQGREAARRFVSTARRFNGSESDADAEMIGEIERNLTH